MHPSGPGAGRQGLQFKGQPVLPAPTPHQLRPLGPDEPAGLYVELGPGPEILAAIAPGMVARVPVAAWRLVGLGEPLTLTSGTRTVALDGQRELAVDGEVTASVTAAGPRVVDIRVTLEAAVRHG